MMKLFWIFHLSGFDVISVNKELPCPLSMYTIVFRNTFHWNPTDALILLNESLTLWNYIVLNLIVLQELLINNANKLTFMYFLDLLTVILIECKFNSFCNPFILCMLLYHNHIPSFMLKDIVLYILSIWDHTVNLS